MATAPSEKKSNALKARVEAAINKIVPEGGKPKKWNIIATSPGTLHHHNTIPQNVADILD